MIYAVSYLFIFNILLGDDHMLERSFIYKANNEEQVDLGYILYLPAEYENTDCSFPLVLFLHGAGERGDDLEKIKIHGIPRLISEGRTFPFICIAPQCPEGGYWDRPEYVSTLISLVKEMEKEHRVDSNRIYCTGLSMGGLGTLAMAIREPKLFSAIIPVCGGADMENIHKLSELPIWLFHGDRDDVIPLDNSIAIYQDLRLVNEHIFLTVYGDVYHDSWTETYENDDTYDWLLKYKK
jgi:predicted peptidase